MHRPQELTATATIDDHHARGERPAAEPVREGNGAVLRPIPDSKKRFVLARNVVWNLAGQVLPLVVAFFAIPLLIERLGKDRFGIVTLAWLVVGYFSLFDLGLGRALTKTVSARLGAGQVQEIPSLVWTSLLIMALMGVLASTIVVLMSPWLVRHVIKVPGFLRDEATQALVLLALSLPFVVTSSGLRGVLEAYQRFRPLNLVGGVIGAFTYIGPVLILRLYDGLVPCIAVLLASRIAMIIFYIAILTTVMPALGHNLAPDRAHIGSLLRFGGWMTISNFVAPIMVSLDRFLIGSLVSVAAITYYAVPYEVSTKLWIIPTALVGVLFPAFSAAAVADRARLESLFSRGFDGLYFVMLPVTVVIVVMSGEILSFWLGGEFARQSTRVMQWLVLGVFINSFAMIPYALIQALGRPDLTAKIHLLEAPIYMLVLWWMIRVFGIEGAAITWVMRVALDSLLLFTVARILLRGGAIRWNRPGRVIGILVPLPTVAAFEFLGVPKAITMPVAVIVCIIACWCRLPLGGRPLLGAAVGAEV